MAREWQENGKRMAREWQENGKRMAKEWQMQLIIDKCTQSETLNRSVGEGRGKREEGRGGGWGTTTLDMPNSKTQQHALMSEHV